MLTVKNIAYKMKDLFDRKGLFIKIKKNSATQNNDLCKKKTEKKSPCMESEKILPFFRKVIDRKQDRK